METNKKYELLKKKQQMFDNMKEKLNQQSKEFEKLKEENEELQIKLNVKIAQQKMHFLEYTKLKERIKSVSSLKVLEDCSVAYNEEQRTVKARCKAYNQAIEDVKQLLTKTK